MHGKMLVAVVVVQVYFALSSAQPSQDCMITTYNETFPDFVMINCSKAYYALFLGTATEDQTMMVCNRDEQCNGIIENIISTCGDEIDSPTRFDLDLLCTNGPNGVNCLTTYFTAITNSTVAPAFEAVATNCIGTCSQTCRENLMILNDTLGCCLTEAFQAQVRNGSVTSDEAYLFTNSFSETCDLPPFPFCNGSTLPPSNTNLLCTNATGDLFGPNDTCTRAVLELLNDNDSAITDLFVDGCPTRFHAYVTACGLNDALELANIVLALSQVSASNGRSCSELLPVFISMEDDDEDPCITDFLARQCSNSCRQTLTYVTTEYGCCFNTLLGELLGRSNEVDDQIEYAIFTREMYELCGISSGGFCTGINPPSYTNAANQCVRARNSFYADDTCLDYYRTLGMLSSATEVNDAATAICSSQRCKNRMSSYNNFLITCRVGSITGDNDDDDEDEDDDNDEEDTGYLDFAYLTGNTTCVVDGNNNTCYSSILFNPEYINVTSAFDSDLNGVCASVTTQGACSQECIQLLNEVRTSVGCCLGEYARALIGHDTTTAISAACNVPLNIECTEIEAIQDVDNGVNIPKGLPVLPVLLLGMITILLF